MLHLVDILQLLQRVDDVHVELKVVLLALHGRHGLVAESSVVALAAGGHKTVAEEAELRRAK